MADEMGLTPEAASGYETYFVPAIFHQWPQRIITLAEPKPDDRILDVGCGTGVLTRQLRAMASEPANLTGVDLSESMLGVAREHCPGVEFHQCSASELPFADASFDLVVSSFMLMFVPEPEQALQEMYRLVAPGGRLVISVWQGLQTNPVYQALVDIAREVLGEESAESLAWPYVLGKPGHLETLFCAAGISTPRIVNRDGNATFPSLEAFVRTEIQSWLLAEHVSDAQIRQIVAEMSNRDLTSNEQADSISFPLNAILARADHD